MPRALSFNLFVQFFSLTLDFLSPCQVSPPQEHPISSENSWTERYQPVSYELESRSGTRGQFVDMVQRCNEAGVR